MERYCFRIDDDFYEREILERLADEGAVMEESDANEKCMAIPTKLQNDVLQILTNYDVDSYFVPAWKTIEDNNGPYFPKPIPNLGATIEIAGVAYAVDKRDQEPLIAYLNLANERQHRPDDETYKYNFWSDYVRYYRPDLSRFSIADVDMWDLRRKLARHKPDVVGPDVREKYGKVLIDGLSTMLYSFAAPSLSLIKRGQNDPNAGRIRKGITKEDVTLNTDGELPPGYTKRQFAPGSFWTAKWTDPFYGTTKYLTLNFETEYVERILRQISSESEAESEVEEERPPRPKRPVKMVRYCFRIDDEFAKRETLDRLTRARGVEIDTSNPYEICARFPFRRREAVLKILDDRGVKYYLSAEREPEPESESEAESEAEDVDYPEEEAPRRRRVAEEIEEEEEGKEVEGIEEPERTPFFGNLSKREANLPLNYVLPEMTQWEVALDAVRSNFTSVASVPKISDAVLARVADACALSLARQQSSIGASRMIAYAAKRGI